MTRRLRSFALPAVLALVGLSLQGCSPRTVVRPPGGGNGNISAGTARLEVVNNSDRPVRSVEASSCSDSNWGANRLGPAAINAGGSMSFDITPGCWDFRADFDSDQSSGNELVQRNIQINSGRSWTWTIGG